MLFRSDQSGEVEFWRHAANGLGESTRVTRKGTTMRHQGVPSPDGKLLAHTDRNQVLWLRELASGAEREVARSQEGNEWDYIDLTWSPDSRWVAYVDLASNQTQRIFLYDTKGQAAPVPITTGRLDSHSPKIGRASGRERVEISGGAVTLKQKSQKRHKHPVRP